MPTIKDRIKSLVDRVKKKHPPIPPRLERMRAMAEAARRAAKKY